MHYDTFPWAFLPLLDTATRLIILKHNSDHLIPPLETALHELTPTQPHQCYSPFSTWPLCRHNVFQIQNYLYLWFFIWKHLCIVLV